MNVRATPALVDPEPASAESAKFLYRSGARPLAGFTLKRGIGRGGFGEVYYATSDAGKDVALKLIRRNLDVELRGVTQCLNLKHPNLLALYDIRQDDQDDSWVVMEYVGGDCLEDVLARRPDGLPLDQVLHWTAGICAAVSYLHDHGIVHRDLKPGNIFCDEGIVKIGDYGLSKFISCSRRSGQTGSVGTVHYMAPEIANGRYGKEIDIYAIGVMLYEMLTGRVPFEGESVGEVLMKHLTAEPDLSKLAPALRAVVGRALAKDANVRFASVADLARALPPALGVPPGASPHVAAAFQPANSSSPPVFTVTAGAGPVVPSTQDGEPLYLAACQVVRGVRAWWLRANFRPWQKVVLALVGATVLVCGIPVWVPASIGFLLVYAVYSIGRTVLLSFYEPRRTPPAVSSSAASFTAEPVPTVPPTPTIPVAARAVGVTPRVVPPSPMAARAFAPPLANTKPPLTAKLVLPILSGRHRLTNLVGSLLFSAIAVCALIVLLAATQRQGVELVQLAWLVAMGIAGAWSVLLPTAIWDGTRHDPAVRRFLLMLLGMGLGVLAFHLQHNVLLVRLPYEPRFVGPPGLGGGLDASQRFPALYSSDGAPGLLASVAYFGFLFLVPRWWRLADPLRDKRVSLWSAATCVFWAFVVNLFWPFPQPWGMLVAAAVALAVQLASPWSDVRNGRAARS